MSVPPHVTVDVKGEDTHEIDLETVSGPRDRSQTVDGNRGRDSDHAPTYADVLATLELSPHEVSVLVDGRPVPEDQPVETEHVTVLRLITGG